MKLNKENEMHKLILAACALFTVGMSHASNQVPLIVDGGNPRATISVKVCAPNFNIFAAPICKTIDNIIVDTGSAGLHIKDSALDMSDGDKDRLRNALPLAKNLNGTAVGECERYITSYTWGALKTADVTIGDDTAHLAPVQIVGGKDLATAPASCAQGTLNDYETNNGLIGAAAQAVDAGSYYACPATGCIGTEEQDSNKNQATINSKDWDIAKRLLFPVNISPQALFEKNNNGVIVDLPAIPPAGASRVEGTLTFGINTQLNNLLLAHAYRPVFTSTYAIVQTSVDGTDNLTAFDTGWPLETLSNLDSTRFPTCTISDDNFYCPTTAQSVRLGIKDNGSNRSATFDFPIGNASSLDPWPALSAVRTLVQSSTTNDQLSIAGNGVMSIILRALSGGPILTSINNSNVWGLNFFYGKRIFVSRDDGNSTLSPDGMVKNGFYAIAPSTLPAVVPPADWGANKGWNGDVWNNVQWF